MGFLHIDKKMDISHSLFSRSRKTKDRIDIFGIIYLWLSKN